MSITLGAAFEWSMLGIALVDIGLNLWMVRRERYRRFATEQVSHSASALRTARLMAAEARWRVAFAATLALGAVRWLRIPDTGSPAAEQLKGAFFLLAVLLLAKSLHNIWQSREINADYEAEQARRAI